MRQEEALHFLKMGHNVFLTGAAGSGKTFLLNQYIQYLKDHEVAVAITASTGIAATHLQGVTLHAWSGIGVKESLSDKDLRKLLENKRIVRNYRNTKALIIDEISMLHKNYLDMLDTAARYILGKDQPFGGMQLVLCGDFFQLPPVTAASTNLLEKPFAFEASCWSLANFQVCYLEEQHRQKNDPLLDILNDIRNGTAGEQTKVPLRTRYKKEPVGGMSPTRLYARNINVDCINREELAKIASPVKIYTMESEGFSALADSLKKNCLALEVLHLKLDAEVIFIKNDVQNGRYVNGTRAKVIGFDGSQDAWPIVKTYDKRTITVTPEAWNYEDNGVVRASIIQVPLRLAWAITIHKSQGMTLDAAEMDLGDAFEPGMGYVALSRVRSLSGLKLMNLNEMALKVHPQVLERDVAFKESSADGVSYLKSLSPGNLESLEKETLILRFRGTLTSSSSSALSGLSKKSKRKPKQKKEKPDTLRKSLELLQETQCIETTAQKRQLTYNTILTHVEKLKGLGHLDETFLQTLKDKIQNRLADEDFKLIMGALLLSEDGKLKTIYDTFEGKFSYADIQTVRLFV